MSLYFQPTISRSSFCYIGTTGYKSEVRLSQQNGMKLFLKFHLLFLHICFFSIYISYQTMGFNSVHLKWTVLTHCTEVHFASFLSGGFTSMAVINSPERKLAKHTSVQCTAKDWYSGHSESTGRKTATSHLCAIMYYVFFLYKIFGLPQTLVIIRKIIFSLKSCPLLLVF